MGEFLGPPLDVKLIDENRWEQNFQVFPFCEALIMKKL
jgi:hypothetical protein